jgi:hypothetical protein
LKRRKEYHKFLQLMKMTSMKKSWLIKKQDMIALVIISEKKIFSITVNLQKRENNCYFIQKIQRPPSPLTEEEIDLLLHSHVATLAYIDWQCIHNPGYEIQTSSISENVNLILNNDSHVFDETLQEVNEPIYDDDFQLGN